MELEEETLLFPRKPLKELTDKELSEKIDDTLEYIHHMPSDLSFEDRDLLKELKRRFDEILHSRSSDDKKLLCDLVEVILYTQTSDEFKVLDKVRKRLLDLTVNKDSD